MVRGRRGRPPLQPRVTRSSGARDAISTEDLDPTLSQSVPEKATFVDLFQPSFSGNKAAAPDTNGGGKDGTTKSFNQLFNASNKGMPLNFLKPMSEIEIVETDIEGKVEYWRNTLVGTVLGRQTTLAHMESLIAKSWNHVSAPEVLYFSKGWFYFRFQNEEDCTTIINDSWNMNGFPLILKHWSTTVVEELHAVSVMPIWVLFPNLDPCFWSIKRLSKVASYVGKPVCADEYTTNKSKLAFARVLIEVDISKELPTSVTFKTPYRGTVTQKIEYEWIPHFCQACRRIGHTKDKCRMGQKPTQVYRKRGPVKASAQQPVVQGSDDLGLENAQTDLCTPQSGVEGAGIIRFSQLPSDEVVEDEQPVDINMEETSLDIDPRGGSKPQ
ncbi:uncharacterized protein LOC141595368 [Silene latifolia]|uniref:uncharacterized protein LOC141595368 n=1 Tax=Silene latifolia TaxID=37657 RepID=UPI003D78A9F6